MPTQCAREYPGQAHGYAQQQHTEADGEDFHGWNA